jgi:hypothetical protein
MTPVQTLRQAMELDPAEWRTLTAACALQILMRALLVVWPLDRVARFTAFRPARRSLAVGAARLQRLVRWSTRLCGGTCLTESFVMRALSARRGLDMPVTVGVNRVGDQLRAHAWPGECGGEAFLPLWRSPVARRRRR